MSIKAQWVDKKCAKCLNDFFGNPNRKVCKSCLEYQSKYRKTHRKVIRVWSKVSREKRLKEGVCQHCNKPVYKKAILCKRHAVDGYLRHNKEQKYTQMMIEKLEQVQKNKCYICLRHIDISEGASIDHVYPKSGSLYEFKAGIDNLFWACMQCNNAKHVYELEAFFEWVKRVYQNNFPDTLLPEHQIKQVLT